MQGFGWPHRFVETPWTEVQDILNRVIWNERPTYLFDIADSVIESGAPEVLAATTSMHDLVVAPRPPGEPPLDVVIVRAPGSLNEPPAGMVRIEHLAVSGHNTSVDRPMAEAVPLFWRFVETEFGIQQAGVES